MSDRWLQNRESLRTTGAHGVDRFSADDRHRGDLVCAAETAVDPDRRDGPRPAVRGGTGVQALAQPGLTSASPGPVRRTVLVVDRVHRAGNAERAGPAYPPVDHPK